MKYIKRTLPFLLLILVLEIVASVIASYRSYGAWQFSDFYTKPMNWHIPVIFLVSNVLAGIYRDHMEKK
ncbi:hypothetical protein PEPCOX59622_01328 [Aedoeadaptatus coxii]|uniref:hypothetical protein n=1 Tax=Aedoeadaptatus coxii TaxID=755172 RepID=UPI00176B504F|nr:hypothetical protein [Peptoniphilus coxii]CAC9933423.1 hypothetical protein PEPCOX59622_01328 [Peptoniphilus coxii]